VTPDELGRLLSLISHEARAPLGVMRGYLRLLEQQGTELSEAHRRAVTAALKASERATAILSDVSHLARLYRAELTPTLSQVALEPLLRAAIHDVVMPADPIVTIHVGAIPNVTLMADESQLRGAIAALTTAVVRAQAADARVYLLAREEAHDGERGVTVTVTALEAVSSTHIDAPLDVMRGGMGLELPIASYVLNAHRGDVLERREDNRFVGVVFWLPVI
jgi:signal transduction histidine kinase